jgi:2-polyprenyl-3-methyl-5-hydroxy-6-metoxy-1,4-benzoquinol methylase
MSTDAIGSWVGFAVVEVIRCFERNGIFAALGRPATAEQLAARLGLPVRPLELTLPILSTLGYLERLGDVYRCRADVDGHLEQLPQLESFLRTGNVGDAIDQRENRGEYYAKSVLGLGQLFKAEASKLAEQLRPVATIADVGAGSAIWSMSMAARHGGRVTAIDRPEVVPATLAAAELIGFEIRPEVIAGDYFDVELDGPVDRIVMANVLHLEMPQDASKLIRHYARFLAPEGELVIIDMIGGEDFEGRISADAYQLHLGMRTTRGRAHAEADLRAWCSEAGLTAQRTLPLGRTGVAALVCSRSAPAIGTREMTTIGVEDLRALRAENEANEARSQMAFEGSADAMMAVDKRSGTIIRTNVAFRALFEVDWASLEIRDPDAVVGPEDRSRFRRLVLGLADGSITERRHTIRMLRNEQPFVAELAAFDPLARSVVCFVVRDRDRLVRAEKLQALGELVGGLTHDLNTPLGILKANCAMAKRIAERLASSGNRTRDLAALDTATSDALRALDKMIAKLEAISRFATLEGPALQALAPHFDSGLALAICERAADR